MSEWYNDPEWTPEQQPDPVSPTVDEPTQDLPEPSAAPAAPAETAPPVVTPSVQDESPFAAFESLFNSEATTETAPVEPTPPVTPVEPPKPPTVPYQPPMTSTPPYGVPPRVTPPYGSPYGMTPPQPPKKPKKKMSATAVAIAVLAVLCSVSLIVSGVLAVKLLGSDTGNQPAVNAPGTSEEDRIINENAPSLQISDSAEFDDGGLSTKDIVAKNLDATVVLTMYETEMSSIYGYYGYDFGTSDNLTQAGAASGIVLSKDGYIITNSHCVFNENTEREYARIDVTLYDGRVFEGAKVIGHDPTTDLAVIKVEANDLTPAEFGDSSALALGDRVVTLGNSGGLNWSVSQGVLSGQARDVYEDTGYAIKCLQVDAVINPGSSGGPLLNMYGQVVGVNSAKIVMTGHEGLGFSIPINEAKAVIDDLVKYGYVTGRVSLGIMGRTITSIGYEGFIIENISNDSAFVGTAAQVGDIITHVEGKRVTDYAEMRAELTSYKVGDTITLTLLRLDKQTRATQELKVDVTLKESR